jgi:DNA-binding NtrC family response regulator
VLSLTVPPLRRRVEDIPLLARHFLARCAQSLRKPVHDIAPAALESLAAHPWPGNVRELENLIERAVNLAQHEQLQVADLPLESVPSRTLSPGTPESDASLDLAAQEMHLIVAALRNTGGNIRLAAQRLNVSRGGLYKKMQRFGLKAERFRAQTP